MLTDQEAIAKAEALGHTLAEDPPHELSRVARLTCRDCGRAVLKREGNVYGSALTEPCQKRAPSRPVGSAELSALGVQLAAPSKRRVETRLVHAAPLDDAMLARVRARVTADRRARRG